MSFDWAALLDVAEALSNADFGVGREACLRTAIGRSYYAAFGSARHHARKRRPQTRQSAAEHGEVSVFFAQQHGDSGVEIAKLLSRLRTNRNSPTTTTNAKIPKGFRRNRLHTRVG